MPTIASTLRSTARRVPEAPALVFGPHRYSYGELDAQVDRTAGALARLGLVKGDRFALMATNSDAFVIAFYAASRLGAIFVPINPASAPPEVRYLLEDSGATIFVHDAALAATVDAARAAGLPRTTRHVLSLPELAELASRESDTNSSELPDTLTEADDALILYTSGTTGKPKGALFDHHRVMWTSVNVIGTCGMRVGDRFLHVAPLYHAAELGIMLIPGTMIGATHVVLARIPACRCPRRAGVRTHHHVLRRAHHVPVPAAPAGCGAARPFGVAHRPVRGRADACQRRRAAHPHLAARELHAAVRADGRRPRRHLL